eukprot:357877-Chlamydomonas_euryale.AAC.4
MRCKQRRACGGRYAESQNQSYMERTQLGNPKAAGNVGDVSNKRDSMDPCPDQIATFRTGTACAICCKGWSLMQQRSPQLQLQLPARRA